MSNGNKLQVHSDGRELEICGPTGHEIDLFMYDDKTIEINFSTESNHESYGASGVVILSKDDAAAILEFFQNAERDGAMG